MAKRKKNFVLDTNVMLHDFQCIYQFEENDIYLPIYVLEELDKFKKGNAQINFNAREFTRELDKLAGGDLFTKGVSLGDKRGKLFVITGKPMPEEFANYFAERTTDHLILSIAHWVKENTTSPTIFVSKDINLRMKAKSLDIPAEDYTTDKVKDPTVLHKPIETFTGFDTEIINRLYKEPAGIPLGDLNLDKNVLPNDCFIFKTSIISR